MTLRLGILGSTRGTNLDAMFHAIQAQKLSATIEIVISNKESAPLLAKAKTFGLPICYLPAVGLTREVYDAKISEVLLQHNVDLVVLIGYMRILSDDFVHTWEKKIINVHPSLLPAFADMMDLEVHAAVLASGVKETGCTVHYVTSQVDAGPILLQKKCLVNPDESAEQLKQRVQVLEGQALIAAISSLAT